MGSLMRFTAVVTIAVLVGGCGWKIVRKAADVQSPVAVAPPSAVAAPEVVVGKSTEGNDSPVLPAQVAVQVHELEQLFSVYNAVGSMPPAQRKDLLTTAAQRHADERRIPAAMHYALLLLHDGSEEQTKRASRILDSVLARTDAAADAELVGLARLLQGLLKNNAQATANGTALAQVVTRREEEIEDLKKQISALKSIEKSLYDRDIGNPADRK